MILAGVPSKPASAPTIGSTTSDTQVQVLVSTVSTTNGAPILSYGIEIDDGLGGAFTVL